MAKSNRDPFAYESPVKLFVRDHICVRHGWDPDETTLEIPLKGRRSMVRLVTGPDGERLVLRIFAGRSGVREARRLEFLSDLLEAHAIPTPRHLRRVPRFGGQRAVLLEEEYVEGCDLLTFPRTPETLRALADTLARLHTVRAPHHGDPMAPRFGGFGRSVVKRFKNRLRPLSRRGPHRPPRVDRRELLMWARAWQPALDALPLHSLIHDKLNPHNVLITPEPRALLLDITTAHWGSPAKDLAQLRHETFDGDDSAWQRVFAHHQEAVGPEIAAEIRTFLPLFEVYFLLGEAAIAAKRLRRVRRGKSSATVTRAPGKIQRFWARALEILRSTPPPIG